ncbi:MAG: tetratricopeptide repeat protein [Pseudomonadota bacterium]
MTSFITELRERRVLPALGVYVASCWVVVEILDRLVERHALPGVLTDIVFWGLYSLLPAVALVAWSYGRPGKDTATRAQKIGGPINLVVTAALLVTLWGGRDLTPETPEPAVAGEAATAEALTASEPESEDQAQRQRMAVFFYENESGDPELDWLQYGVTELLTQDLSQDPYLSANSPYGNWITGYYARLKAAGFDTGIGAPASLLRQIARDSDRRYFVEGTLLKDGEELVVATRLWDADSMRRVAEFEQRGWDLYTMLDAASVRIRTALELPSVEAGGYEDLPLAETYGESKLALQRYIAALNTRMIDNDIPGGLAGLEAALTEDPMFVMAMIAKAQMLVESGNMPASVPVLEELQRLDYRLPENDRAEVMSRYYRATNQSERLLQFTRLQVELTGEARWHIQLGELLLISNDREGAREQLKIGLEKDPLNVDLMLILSDLERSFGNMEGAIDYVRRFQAARPGDMSANIKMGDLLRDSGDLEAADERYREAAVLESDAITPLLRAHVIAARQGEGDEARALLEEAFGRADRSAQLAQVHMMAAQYEARLGRIEPAIEQMRAAEPHFAEAQPPFLVALTVDAAIVGYLMTKKDVDRARVVLQEAQVKVPQPPFSRFLLPMEALIAAEESRFDEAWAAQENFKALLDEFGFAFMQFQVHMGAAGIAYLADDFELMTEEVGAALVEIDRSFLAGEMYTVAVPAALATLAEGQVRNGQLESAEISLRRGFSLDPTSPQLWYVQALLDNARGEEDAAAGALEKVLTTWSTADPALTQYRDAMALAGRPLPAEG